MDADGYFAEHVAATYDAECGEMFGAEAVDPAVELPPGQTAVPFDVGADHFGFDTLDPATQAMTSHHVTVRDGEAEYSSVPFRYVWPAELDLMARMAGMRLDRRCAGWRGEPFTGESTGHVSIWRKADPRAV